ncbi:MAG: helix-turn-helix transcriptional regulator [Candidatus Krumholzibacteria bacterium]|nr:helix-turn-helix transcriptional regulator [Candidatus Krumholzibacteria bacterium]
MNRIDWLDAALDTLEDEGIEKVKVERLARDLGVTKGSFYWHFKDRSDLLEALLDYYYLTCTAPVTDAIRKLDLPADQLLEEVERIVENMGMHTFEKAIYCWAQRDPMAGKHLNENRDRRMAFVLDLFRKAGFAGDEAEARARMFVYRQMGRSLRGSACVS